MFECVCDTRERERERERERDTHTHTALVYYNLRTESGLARARARESVCVSDEGEKKQTAYGCECSYSLKETHPTLGSCLPRNWLYIYDPHLHDYGSTGSKYIVS